jgi:hypothetical protein
VDLPASSSEQSPGFISGALSFLTVSTQYTLQTFNGLKAPQAADNGHASARGWSARNGTAIKLGHETRKAFRQIKMLIGGSDHVTARPALLTLIVVSACL